MKTGDCRNDQAGDWQFDDRGDMIVKSILLKDPLHCILIQFHEAIEAILCQQRGITDEAVSAFDEQFEKERAKGVHGESDEDGDDARAPYRKEHFFATNIERLFAAELGVDWKEYEAAILEYFK